MGHRRGSRSPRPRPTRRRGASFRAGLESLESRALLAIFTVNTAADPPTQADALSLREAIELSNGSLALSALTPRQRAQVTGPAAGPDTIDFAIAPGGVQTIVLSDALPAITVPVLIDGTSQPGYAPGNPSPMIELSGRDLAVNANGLEVDAAGTTIEGLAIGLFGGSGVVLRGGHDAVLGTNIGTDPRGTLDRDNVGNGVSILSSGNTIGGVTPADANLIANNQGSGIVIDSSQGAATGNLVEGNLLGTDRAATRSLGNLLDGVTVQGASGNTIGGTAPGARNVIAGNQRDGILIQRSPAGAAQGNLVRGNRIGTDGAGTGALGNYVNGVEVNGGLGNTIGGTAPGAGNLISANDGAGVLIQSASAMANVVQGNTIGTVVGGLALIRGIPSTAALGNRQGGVVIEGAPANLVGGTAPGSGNLISGNAAGGVRIAGAGARGNRLAGNLIGTDAIGRDGVGSSGNGVTLDDGASFNTIGGTAPAARNVISGNLGAGVLLQRSADHNAIQGNFIGPDAAGTDRPAVDGGFRAGNSQNGITLLGQADDETIGGSVPGARNLISGNGGNGVDVSGNSTGEVIQGNLIGLAAGGRSGLGNAQNGVLLNGVVGNLIGGPQPGARNVLSGNALNGIEITAAGARGSSRIPGNLVQGNRIGTDATGRAAIGNVQNGLAVFNAPRNTVGGTASGAGNLVSGNRLGGISLFGAGATANVLQGNRIGTDASGTRRLGNAQDGLILTDAPGNTLGGSAAGAGNVISGNLGNGIDLKGSGPKAGAGDVVQGNLIGIDAAARRTLGNAAAGVAIVGVPGIVIGGTAARARNVISGNGTNGITVSGSPRVAILGNFLGTDGAGAGAVPNAEDGILIRSSASVSIGGTARGAGNVISGNGASGVEISGATSRNNVLQGNVIGPAAGGGAFVVGAAGYGNLVGVTIGGAPANLIGGTTPAARNLISGNSRPDGSGVGVEIVGATASGNRIWGDTLGADATGTRPLRNDIGVVVNGAPRNLIGGAVGGAGNLISGNVRPDSSGVGVEIVGAGAAADVVSGNLIGTDRSGTRAISASRPDVGILISDTSGANVIGGTTPAARNVLAGFKVGIELFAAQSQFNEVPGSVVEGNFIGTDATGRAVLGNTVGVYLNGVPLNTIGGTAPGARNVISGNQTGLYLLGASATRNLIQGNFLGLDPSGTRPEGNHVGIALNGSSRNSILGDVIAGDLVADGEGSIGIYLVDGSAGNAIQGNFIGTDADGRAGPGLAQGDYGVLLFNAPNNPIATSSRSNRIVGSGIANVREYSGPG